MVNVNYNIKNYVLKIATVLIAIFMIPAFSNAAIVLDNIQFDPAIISAGDQVDIVVQFHDEIKGTTQSSKIGNSNYEYEVKLVADDTISQKYIIMQDASGHDVFGTIYAGGNYNKKFRVKVAMNAPPGDYQFKLVGQWYKNGVIDGGTQELTFLMPVKKEGISLSLSNIISTPGKIRSGDKNVLLDASLFNSGEKLAKDIHISFEYPSGISAAYTNNNQILIGVVNPMEEKKIQVYVDTEKYLTSKVYDINYTLSYKDADSNNYLKSGVIPLVIKKKPQIEVLSSSATSTAGSDIILEVVLKNVGEEKAESVDARIVKQSSQPFEMDVRSAYIGQLEPNQSGTAVFLIHANSDAEIKTHNLNLAIRAKGDSNEGDSNIYTFSDSAKIDITGKSQNNYPMYGIALIALIIFGSVIFYTLKSKNKK